MIFDAADFVFQPPAEVAFARRVLIKPSAAYPSHYPVTTSREILTSVITGIRKVSDADILLLEGNTGRGSMKSIYQVLGYNFPRTVMLDVNECALLEIENPLPKPFSLSTIWVPSIILSCDFLITVAQFHIAGQSGSFSIRNLLGLLPTAKYLGETTDFSSFWQRLGIHGAIADFHFTLPFDLGIIDGRKKLISVDDPMLGSSEDYGKIFVGSPYEVDCEASRAAGVETRHLRLIEKAKAEHIDIEQSGWLEAMKRSNSK
ncbi:DUF362 domain-containing protein [Chloroflexota bacterium]